jgi:hypothetical protein
MIKRTALLFAAAACMACGAAASSTDTSLDVAPEAHRDRNSISAEEMTKVSALNLYEVVQRIHPEWFKVRSTSTTGQRTGTVMTTDQEVQVYIDQQRAGNTEILKTMAIRSAASLRYYSASEAQVKFGSGNLSGAIQVVTALK